MMFIFFGPVRYKIYFSFASPARPYGKIISRLPARPGLLGKINTHLQALSCPFKTARTHADLYFSDHAVKRDKLKRCIDNSKFFE